MGHGLQLLRQPLGLSFQAAMNSTASQYMLNYNNKWHWFMLYMFESTNVYHIAVKTLWKLATCSRYNDYFTREKNVLDLNVVNACSNLVSLNSRQWCLWGLTEFPVWDLSDFVWRFIVCSLSPYKFQVHNLLSTRKEKLTESTVMNQWLGDFVYRFPSQPSQSAYYNTSILTLHHFLHVSTASFFCFW